MATRIRAFFFLVFFSFFFSPFFYSYSCGRVLKLLKRAVSIKYRFGLWIHWFRVDRIPIRVKNMRFQKSLDSCGLGPSAYSEMVARFLFSVYISGPFFHPRRPARLDFPSSPLSAPRSPRMQFFKRVITLSIGQISIYWIAQLVFLILIHRMQ